MGVEKAATFVEIPHHWNVQTGICLRHYVYDRTTPKGKKPGFTNILITQVVSGVWHGLYAPKGTPKPILDKLVAALQASVQDAGFKSRLAELGAEPVPLAKANPESLRTHLQAEISKWAPVIKSAGIKAE